MSQYDEEGQEEGEEMLLHDDATRRRIASQQEREKQAQQIAHLKERWITFSFPVQEMLKLHLHFYGVRSAQDTTDILERSRTTTKGTNQ